MTAAPAPPISAAGLAKSPPIDLPMRHFVSAAVAFWIFAAALAGGTGRFFGFDFQAKWVLGLVHIMTLGWITMTMFGAIIQLSAVLWETPVAWPGAVRGAWWAFTLGLIGFVAELWSGGSRYWIPAALLFGAVVVYLACFVRTMAAAPRLDWTARHLAVSVSCLAAVVTLGFLMAWDRDRGVLFRDTTGALIAHVHLALVGWVTLTVVGVSYRLVSMFALSHIESKTPGRLALALACAGLGGLALDGLFFGRRLMPLWAGLLAGAYLSYAWQMRAIFSARHRRIDPALAYTLLALVGGALWTVLGVLLACGMLPEESHVFAAYIYACLIGWATPFILGQIHKIVPFLVWLHIFGRRPWSAEKPPPKMTDLASERLAWAEFFAVAPAVLLGVAGFLAESRLVLEAGSLFLLAGATLYVSNTAFTLSFLVREGGWTGTSSRS
ncbi:MAG: hypothetical protein KGM24_11045 [Elusimicrobia bacterium]|nr:hypothetical protein [Elusimicrobiota bacterium]